MKSVETAITAIAIAGMQIKAAMRICFLILIVGKIKEKRNRHDT